MKKIITFLLVGVMIFSLAGCGSKKEESSKGNTGDSVSSDASVSDDKKENLKELRIGAGGTDGSEALEGATLAVKNGYLEEELNAVGYTLKLTALQTGGPEINEALAAGELDGAIVGDFPVFTAESKGIDTTIVALTNSKNQYAILANEDLKEPKDLEGKKVIVPVGTVAQYYWEHYTEANEIDTSKIEIINAATDATSLLQSKEADAYVITKYIASYMSTQGIGTILQGGVDVSTEGATTFVFEVKSDLLEENEELGVAINKALIRSYEEALNNPEGLFEALSSESVTPEAWKESYSFDDTLSFLSPEITADTKNYYNNLMQWMLDHSIITETVDVDSFVDDSYYQKAKEALEN